MFEFGETRVDTQETSMWKTMADNFTVRISEMSPLHLGIRGELL